MYMYYLEPFSIPAQTLGLPSSCHWIPVSSVVVTGTYKPLRLQLTAAAGADPALTQRHTFTHAQSCHWVSLTQVSPHRHMEFLTHGLTAIAGTQTHSVGGPSLKELWKKIGQAGLVRCSSPQRRRNSYQGENCTWLASLSLLLLTQIAPPWIVFLSLPLACLLNIPE